jgi:hypothetical protein
MTICRHKLPYLKKTAVRTSITYKTDLTLNDEAKWLVPDHCLQDDGKRQELQSAVVMSTHVHLIVTRLLDGLISGWHQSAQARRLCYKANTHPVIFETAS